MFWISFWNCVVVGGSRQIYLTSKGKKRTITSRLLAKGDEDKLVCFDVVSWPFSSTFWESALNSECFSPRYWPRIESLHLFPPTGIFPNHWLLLEILLNSVLLVCQVAAPGPIYWCQFEPWPHDVPSHVHGKLVLKVTMWWHWQWLAQK